MSVIDWKWIKCRMYTHSGAPLQVFCRKNIQATSDSPVGRVRSSSTYTVGTHMTAIVVVHMPGTVETTAKCGDWL